MMAEENALHSVDAQQHWLSCQSRLVHFVTQTMSWLYVIWLLPVEGRYTPCPLQLQFLSWVHLPVEWSGFPIPLFSSSSCESICCHYILIVESALLWHNQMSPNYLRNKIQILSLYPLHPAWKTESENHCWTARGKAKRERRKTEDLPRSFEESIWKSE